jgi:hypothetical protein
MKINDNEAINLEVDIHLVENQLFYAPLILAACDVNKPNRAIRQSELKTFLDDNNIKAKINFISESQNQFSKHYKTDFKYSPKLENAEGIVPLMFSRDFRNSLQMNPEKINLFQVAWNLINT